MSYFRRITYTIEIHFMFYNLGRGESHPSISLTPSLGSWIIESTASIYNQATSHQMMDKTKRDILEILTKISPPWLCPEKTGLNWPSLILNLQRYFNLLPLVANPHPNGRKMYSSSRRSAFLKFQKPQIPKVSSPICACT